MVSLPKVPVVPSPLSRVVGSAGPNGPLWIRSGTIVRSSHGIVSLTASPALTQGCPTLTHFIHRNIFCDWTLKDFNLWLIPSQHRARQHCYKAEPLLCVPKLDISDGHIEKDMVLLMHDSSCATIPHGCHQNILWGSKQQRMIWLFCPHSPGQDQSGAKYENLANSEEQRTIFSANINQASAPLPDNWLPHHALSKYMFGPRIWSPGRNTNRCYFKSF